MGVAVRPEEGLDSGDTWRGEAAGLGSRLGWGLDWKCSGALNWGWWLGRPERVLCHWGLSAGPS